ncbi:MAG: glutamine amidotransferase [Pirellulales bacterium]
MELHFSPVGGPWLVAVVAALLVALLPLKPAHVELSRARLWVLRLLRFCVVVLTLIAMLRPTLVYTDEKPLQASLLVLIDDSRSMSVKDSLGNLSRWDSLKAMLEDASSAIETLAETWDVRAYQFDTDTKPVPVEDGSVKLGDEATGEQSALGAALEDVLERESAQRVLGVVVLSDGAQRAAPPRDAAPQLTARRYAAEGIPIYAVTFGQPGSGERADIAVEDLLTGDTIFASTPTEVTGRLRYGGYANQQVPVQLLWETTEGEMAGVDAMQVRLDGQSGTLPIRLQHTPSEPGEYKVTLRVEPREGEQVTTNNEASTFVTVRAGGIRVLYLVGATRVGGEPSLEQRFIRGALAASPDIVVTRQRFDYRQEREDLRDEFEPGKYDVYILDDLDSLALDLPSWRALEASVQRGAGLIMIGGYHSFGPGGFLGTPVAGLLPVELGRAERQNFDEKLRDDVHLSGPLKMRPAAPLGPSHPVMQIAPEGNSAELWSEIPELDGANLLERSRLKPNAMVLAESADNARHPLLIAGQPGEGRVLAFAGDSTWRWVTQGFADAHRRFWRQVILWLAKKDQQKEGEVWIELAQRRVPRGSRVELAVGAQPTAGETQVNPTFDVTIATPDGEPVGLNTTPAEDRHTATFNQTGQPGDYTVTVVARQGDKELGTATARFLVPDEDLELDRPAAEPTLMAQLARLTADSGGRALAPEELPQLLAELADREPEVKQEVLERVTYWDKWPFFLLFVGLLGVEWYLRKRWGLV